MRRIVLYTAASMDGMIARADGGIDWLYTDQDYGYQAFVDTIDTTLMGGATYRQIVTLPDFSMPGTENWVFTRSPGNDAVPGFRFTSEDPARFAASLKERPGRDIWLVGGGQINARLLAAGLVDRIVLSLHPVAVGRGIPLFAGEHDLARFRTVESRCYDSGLVQWTMEKG